MVGFVVSFTPGFEGIELESEVLLSVVLPPLLYSAALDFSFPTFLRNIRPILGLGIGLVVVTAFTVAAVTPLLVPTLTFGTALVLGAVVAPPDAVTAVAVGRKLGLPRKVMAILTGESLVNDAAALSLFSIEVAQIAGTEAYIENPLLLFGYSAVLGPLVGAALGYITFADPLAGWPIPGWKPFRALWFRSRRSSLPSTSTRRGFLRPGGRLRGWPWLNRVRVSDAPAGALCVELRRHAARGVRVRLHRAAVAVRAGGVA